MNQSLAKTINQRLNSCIQIESAKINRRVSIPDRIDFCLDTQLLEDIEQIRASNIRLKLSARNLANLRHYALLNLPTDLIRDRRELESSGCSYITFATRYSASRDRPITLFSSAIDFEGKISQQVHKNLYQNSLLLTQISQAHYWLVLEVLAQLPLESKFWYSWFVLVFFVVAVAIACSLVWYLNLSFLFKTAVCVGILLFSKLVFKTSIVQKLKSWVIYHLLEGIFARGSRRRQLGIKLLSFLAACN